MMECGPDRAPCGRDEAERQEADDEADRHVRVEGRENDRARRHREHRYDENAARRAVHLEPLRNSGAA